MKIEGLPVADGNEARTLCLHHLRLAAQYFEATDEDFIETLPANDFSLPAMTVWAKAMDDLYPQEGAQFVGYWNGKIWEEIELTIEG